MVADSMAQHLSTKANRQILAAADVEARKEERERLEAQARRAEQHEAKLDAMRLCGALDAMRLRSIGREESGPIDQAEFPAGISARMDEQDRSNEIREAIANDRGGWLDPLPPEHYEAELEMKRSKFRRNWLRNPLNAERLRRQVVKDELGIGHRRRASNSHSCAMCGADHAVESPRHRSVPLAGEYIRDGGPITGIG